MPDCFVAIYLFAIVGPLILLFAKPGGYLFVLDAFVLRLAIYLFASRRVGQNGYLFVTAQLAIYSFAHIGFAPKSLGAPT